MPVNARKIVASARFWILRPDMFLNSDRSRLQESSSSPSEGIYYWLPKPDGTWRIFVYRYDEFPEIDHSELWEKYVAALVAYNWADSLGRNVSDIEQDLANVPYGLPRGRVAKALSGFSIYHGDDTPEGYSLNSVAAAFSLKSPKSSKDPHEIQLAGDKAAVSRVLSPRRLPKSKKSSSRR